MLTPILSIRRVAEALPHSKTEMTEIRGTSDDTVGDDEGKSESPDTADEGSTPTPFQNR